MKLVKIKNKYMYTPAENEKENYKPEGIHIYAVYKDKTTGATVAIQTTHLLEHKKVLKIISKKLLPIKLPDIDFMSGIKKGLIVQDVNGNPLDLKKVKAVNVKEGKTTYLRKSQADKIKAFAGKKVRKKKKP